MPLEVTPVPFADQQLPYTPKFTPLDLDGLPMGTAGSLVRGPASAAGSAIIPPVPGSIASPQRAIPALPDAGYTAPSMHAASVSGVPAYIGGRPPPNAGGYGDSGSVFGNSAFGAGSVYGGASVYERPGDHGEVGPMSTIYSDGWVPASLPAPRRAPVLAQRSFVPVAPSRVAMHPSSTHDHQHELQVNGERHPIEHDHHHHRQDDRNHYQVPHAAADDAKSDTSYYSRPRPRRHRSASSSPTSDVSSPRRPAHKRAPSAGYVRRDLSPHEEYAQGSHSPIQPSPLGRPIPISKEDLRGASLRRAGHDRGRRASDATEQRYRDVHVEEDINAKHRGSASHSRLPPRQNSLSDSETSSYGRGRSRPNRRHSQSRSKAERADFRDANGDNDEQGPYKRLNRLSLQDEPRHQVDRPHHHRHRSHSHKRRSPSKAASPRPAESPFPLAAPRMSGTSLLAPPDSYERPRQRSPSFSGVDRQGLATSPYQAPSVAGVGPVEAFDDGESIAGTALTFMDGSVGGRVSQYGLPKYAHQPKMDYRRFCVQRGNADVFLD